VESKRIFVGWIGILSVGSMAIVKMAKKEVTQKTLTQQRLCWLEHGIAPQKMK
jgi:hypothetical protein